MKIVDYCPNAFDLRGVIGGGGALCVGVYVSGERDYAIRRLNAYLTALNVGIAEDFILNVAGNLCVTTRRAEGILGTSGCNSGDESQN